METSFGQMTKANARLRRLPERGWSCKTSLRKLHYMNTRIARVVLPPILGLVSVLTSAIGLHAAEPISAKPVFLYCLHFNAEGETRYLPEGTYQQVLQRLQAQFEVRVNREALTDANLAGFGLGFTNLYTDVKKLAVPRNTPVIGGLTWAFYTGNLLLINTNHSARPRALVMNDLRVKPLNGPRDQPGALLAVAELGKGRVVAVTDAGWITNDVLADKGIGGVVITNHDNWEIYQRLVRWAAGMKQASQ